MLRTLKRSSGFTLVETLLAASLVAIIGFAIYASFDSGIRVMERVNRVGEEEDLNIFFEKLATEIQNSFRHKTIHFEGIPEKFSFPTLVQTNEELGGARSIGRVSYFYDSSSQSVQKTQENVSDIFIKEEKEEEVVKPKRVLGGVRSLFFQYYDHDPIKGTYSWRGDWGEDAIDRIPLAVRVELVFEKGEGKTVVRTISLSIGG